MSGFSIRAGLLLRLACVMGLALLFVGTARAATPVEYVKVCSVYGAGFWYVPGTDTCIKVGGYVRADAYQTGTGAVCRGGYFDPGSTCGGRGPTTVDVRRCLYGAGFYYIPGTDTCIKVGGYVSPQGTRWGWGGLEGGFGAYSGNLTTLEQFTLGTRDLLSPDNSTGLSGATGRIGVAGGMDWTVGGGIEHRWFVGWEANFDYEFGSLNTVHGFPGTQLFTPLGVGTDMVSLMKSWDGGFGPRVGVMLNNFNIYGTAGVAFGSFSIRADCGTGLCLQNGIPVFEISSSTTRAGWYVGAGFTTGQGLMNVGDGNWRWGGELRYTDYGTVNITTGNPLAAQWNFGWRAQEVTGMLRVMHRFYF